MQTKFAFLATGREKQSVTVILGVDMLNNIKMKPFIILKGKTKRCINNIPEYKAHKRLVQFLKVYIYNNRNMDKKINKDIPKNQSDKIFWALSKNFTWSEVEKLLTKMEESEIDFDENLEEIKQNILIAIKKNTKLKKFFKKYLKRIDYFIDKFENSSESERDPDFETDSSSVISDYDEIDSDDDKNNNKDDNKKNDKKIIDIHMLLKYLR